MANSVVHFAVYADDPEGLMPFYESVFGWSFEAWGPPGFWLISTGATHDPGITEGALSKRICPRGDGAPNAYRCTISVLDLDATMTAVEASGGTIRPPAATIPGIGRVVELLDPEGNLLCAMQYAPGDPRAATA